MGKSINQFIKYEPFGRYPKSIPKMQLTLIGQMTYRKSKL